MGGWTGRIWARAAAVLACVALVAAAGAGTAWLLASHRNDPGRIAGSVVYTTRHEPVPFRTTTVRDDSRPAGTVISKGVKGERTIRYAQAPGGRPVKYSDRVTSRPVDQVEVGVSGTADVTALDAPAPGQAQAPRDGTPQGAPAQQAVPAQQDAQAQRTAAEGFYASLVRGGVGTLDGHLVTWADPGVLGVDAGRMASGGIRGNTPLTRDAQGVWHATASGNVAAGAPADVPIGSLIGTSIGVLEVVDHDESGSWNIMTSWRSGGPV